MIDGTLAHFRVTAKLGEGGMGEVYRATDTRLGREVALKVLPAAFVADAERLARFEREARVLASLNHPNVAAIHEVGEEGGTHFLVMELAPGETLAERMARGPVPVREAIPIALQVATALEAAHERGIVHRDLKPANVKVDGDGRVKVLDFGLAKALDPEPGSAPAPGLTHSPTLTLQATQAGVLLGTAAYMSPEQAKGQPADKRADIWAFGVVLWEMLSGRRLFQESSISETLAAVLKSAPDPRELPPVPPALRTLLDRCLRKDPRERLHDAADVRIALEDALAAPVGATEARPLATRSASSRAARAAAAVLLLAGALALGWVLGARRDDGAPRSIRFAIHPPRGVGFVQDPAVADDGSFLVYKGWTDDGSRLFLHHVDRFASQPLAGTEGADLPFLSPDGRWVGFVRDGDLLRVPTAGGEALLIAENAAQGPGATWGPRGSIVYSTAWLGGLAEMPADGGAARQLTTPDAAQGERGHWWPQFLPGGRAVLFTVWRAGSGLNDARLAVLDLDSGRYRTLLPGSNAFYLRSGHLVYYRAGIHYAVPFDADSLEVRGEPVRVLDEVRELAPQGTRDTSLALSPAGTLAFVTGHLMPESTFVWATADGEVEALPLPPRSYQDLRLSPDGRRAGVATLEAGRYVVRLVDLERGVEQALQMTGSNWDLAWHPDGERLAFSSMRKGDFDVYWRDLAAGTPEEPLLDSETDEWPEDFSPDGSRLVYVESMPDGQYEVRALELGGGKPQTLFPEQENVAVSPDGRWLAYGEGQTSVRPFGRPGAAVQVSRRGGGAPVWSRTEPLLLYRRGSEIVASSYREEQGRFLVGEERVLVDVPGLRRYGRTFDLAPDGRILALVGDYPAAEIHVALGWDREVARLLDGAAAR